MRINGPHMGRLPENGYLNSGNNSPPLRLKSQLSQRETISLWRKWGTAV